MSLKLNSSGGGSVTLQEPSTASDRILTLPDNTGTVVSTASTGVVSQAMLASGVAGNGPAFYATKAAGGQTVSSNVQTKITVTTEVFDTASCYDTSNSRFTPTVAGYYQINYAIYGGGTTNTQAVISALYKNGAIYGSINISGTYLYVPAAYSDASSAGSALVYMNGTSDYLELYGLILGSGTLSISQARFDGCLVRSA